MQQVTKLILVALRWIGIVGTFLCGIVAVAILVHYGFSHMIVMGTLSLACLGLWIVAERRIRDNV
jgi:hypothetical protein